MLAQNLRLKNHRLLHVKSNQVWRIRTLEMHCPWSTLHFDRWKWQHLSVPWSHHHLVDPTNSPHYGPSSRGDCLGHGYSWPTQCGIGFSNLIVLFLSILLNITQKQKWSMFEPLVFCVRHHSPKTCNSGVFLGFTKFVVVKPQNHND